MWPPSAHRASPTIKKHCRFWMRPSRQARGREREDAGTLRPWPGAVPASCTLAISDCTAVENDRASNGSPLRVAIAVVQRHVISDVSDVWCSVQSHRACAPYQGTHHHMLTRCPCAWMDPGTPGIEPQFFAWTAWKAIGGCGAARPRCIDTPANDAWCPVHAFAIGRNSPSAEGTTHL